MTAHSNFEERRTNLPAGSKWEKLDQPLGDDVDLVLFESTANDYPTAPAAAGEPGYLPTTEALLRYFLNLHGRGGAEAEEAAPLPVESPGKGGDGADLRRWTALQATRLAAAPTVS